VQLATLRSKYRALASVFTERSRRIWGATEARAIGHRGIALVERATGISRSTIQRGTRELEGGTTLPPERTRKPGAGRKRATAHDPTLLRDLDALVEPMAPGDPDSPLRWTTKSVRTLAIALEGLGHQVSHTVVAELLHELGYSLQGNAKTREGRQHPDLDAQFRYIAEAVRREQRRRQPTISVDTKKKELVGDFKSSGRTWRPIGQPTSVRVHDFLIPGPAGGKAIPYGVYDLQRDEGWVSVGLDHDTRELRGQRDSAVVAADGPSHLPGRALPADYGRCRRQQWHAAAPVEMGVAALRRPDRFGDHRLPFPSRDQQMESDRASPVLPYRHELARHTARRPGHNRESDRVHPQSVWAAGPI
jgi:transposase